jgi:hypothetical protein
MDLSDLNSARKLENSGELPNLFFAELINSREKSNLPAPENTASLEEWREVVGYEGDYEVSSHGRVRSFVRGAQGRILPPQAKGIGSPLCPVAT